MTKAAEREPHSPRRWSNPASKLVVSLLLAAGFGALLYRGGLPILPPTESFAHVRPWPLVLFILCNVVMHVVKAWRWRHLLKPLGEVPTRILFAVSWVSHAMLLLLPLRAGEVVRPVLIARRTSIKAWEAAGTVGAERIVDGLMLSALLLGALQFATTNESGPRKIAGMTVHPGAVLATAYGVFAVFTIAFAIMALFYWRRAFARRLTHVVVGFVSTRLADTLAQIIERVASGLQFLPDRRHVAPFLFETALFWALNVLTAWFCALGVGLTDFTLARAAATLGCVGIGVLVPSGPGFFGVYQLSTYVGLALFFQDDVVMGIGAAYVFVSYVTQVGVHVLFALVGILLDPRTKLRDVEKIARERTDHALLDI